MAEVAEAAGVVRGLGAVVVQAEVEAGGGPGVSGAPATAAAVLLRPVGKQSGEPDGDRGERRTAAMA